MTQPTPELSLNEATIEQATVDEAIDLCARFGIAHVGLWRHKVAERGTKYVRRHVTDAGVSVSSLCRAGFFPSATKKGRQSAIADARRGIEEAAELGAQVLVVVSGPPAPRDIGAALAQIRDALLELAPHAVAHKVRLGIEPMHPMFIADRSAVVTLTQATALAQTVASDSVGLVVDAYHVWWDPRLEEAIAQASGTILCYQISDWRVPIDDHLYGRAMIGDGLIDLPYISRLVHRAGYRGPIEVEILSRQLQRRNADEVVSEVRDRFRAMTSKLSTYSEIS